MLKRFIVMACMAATAFVPAAYAREKAPPIVLSEAARGVIITEGELADRLYRVVGEVSVEVEKQSLVDRPPLKDKVDNALRAEAAAMGAQAVIQVRYESMGFQFTSLGSMTGKGKAVVFVNSLAETGTEPPPVSAAPGVPAIAPVPVKGDMVALVQTFVDAMNKGDVARALALFAPDATVEDPAGGNVTQGPAAIAAYLKNLTAMDVRYQPLMPPRAGVSNSAAVAARILAGGTVREAIGVFTFLTDGRIANVKIY